LDEADLLLTWSIHPRPSATPAPERLGTGSGGQDALGRVFEIQLYILKISMKYYFMLIVLKMNALVFSKKSTHSGKYGFYLMHK
jgi:hypothetical protein